MKQIIISTFLSVFLFSCKRETNMTQTTVKNTVTSGSWSISFYEDSGENETSDFQGWIFYFGEDGVLRCEKDGVTSNGTWSISDSSSDDDSIDDLDFNIVLYGNPLSELTDDWDIQNYENKTIQLHDVSGGNGGIDILTFTKN